jgi:hypothetical protein
MVKEWYFDQRELKERARGDARRGKGKGKAECQGVAQIDAGQMSETQSGGRTEVHRHDQGQ